MTDLTLFSVFMIGLSYGATACMLSCMPFLAPLLLQNKDSFKGTINILIPFSLGRIISYGAISIIAFSSSILIKNILNDNTNFRIFLGTITLILAIYLLYRIFTPTQSACKAKNSFPDQNRFKTPTIFLIGVLISINPCLPILTLIGFSANASSLSSAIALGISFGLGAVLLPFLFYTLFVSNIIQGLIEQFKNYIKIIEISGALFLASIGILTILGKISF